MTWGIAWFIAWAVVAFVYHAYQIDRLRQRVTELESGVADSQESDA